MAPLDAPSTTHVRVFQAGLLCGAVAYSGVLIEAALGFPLDTTTAYLSELAASDQHFPWLFRAADILAGLMMVLVALGLWSATRHRTPAYRARLAVGGLFAFGAVTVVDTLLPLECAPSASFDCAAAEAAGTIGLAHKAHAVTSVLADTGGVVMAVGVGLLGLAGEAWRRWRVTAVGLLVVVTSAIITVMGLIGEITGDPVPSIGIVQRVQTIAFCLCLLCVVPAVTGRRAFWSTRASHRPESAVSQ